MLIKAIFNGGDYPRSLKRRRLAAGALLAVGPVGFACYFALVPSSAMGYYAQGFHLGAASGITAGAVILLLRTQYLLTHPAAQRKAQVKETDERERQITSLAVQFAGLLTFFAAAAALFVVIPISRTAVLALLCVMAVFCLSFLAAAAYLSKKM